MFAGLQVYLTGLVKNLPEVRVWIQRKKEISGKWFSKTHQKIKKKKIQHQKIEYKMKTKSIYLPILASASLTQHVAARQTHVKATTRKTFNSLWRSILSCCPGNPLCFMHSTFGSVRSSSSVVLLSVSRRRKLRVSFSRFRLLFAFFFLLYITTLCDPVWLLAQFSESDCLLIFYFSTTPAASKVFGTPNVRICFSHNYRTEIFICPLSLSGAELLRLNFSPLEQTKKTHSHSAPE